MPQLRYMDDEGHIVTVDLVQDKVTLGRSETSDIRIQGELVSREHAQILREPDGRYRLRDLGSRNKTYVNGQVVSEVLLSNGDMIRVGERVIEFMEDEVAQTGAVRDYFITDREEPAPCEWIKVKDPLTLNTAQLERLAALVEQAGVMPRVSDVADLALSRLMKDLSAERGFIALKGEEAKGLEVLTARGLSRAGVAGSTFVGISQSFVFSGLLQKVAGRYPVEAKEEVPRGYPMSALVAPLIFNGKEIGVIYIDRPGGKRPFGTGHLYHLIAAGAQLGAAIGRTQERLSSQYGEFATATQAVIRRLQRSLFVEPSPGESFTAAVRLIPGTERCGDIQEVIGLDENRVLVMVADASGQGVSGLLQASNVFTGIRAAIGPRVEETPDLGAIVTEVSQSVARRRERQLVGVCVVLVDLAAGRAGYVNAGLPAPMLLAGPQRLITLDRTDLLIGTDPEHVYEGVYVDIPARLRLVVYTRGVIEAVSAGEEAYGEERLHELMLEPGMFTEPAALLERIAEAVTGFAGQANLPDDGLLVALGRG